MDGDKYPNCVDHVEESIKKTDKGESIEWLKVYYKNGLVVEHPKTTPITDIDKVQETKNIPEPISDTDIIMSAIADIYEIILNKG